MFAALMDKGFQIAFHSHARAILAHDFPEAALELEAALDDFVLPIEELAGSGGGESKGTQRLRRALAATGWSKFTFVLEKRINGVPRESISHEIDHVKEYADGRRLALEIEWNNKDPFFDRDLENFKRLHAEGAMSVGLIVTRGVSLQSSLPDFIARYVRSKNFGALEDLAAIGLHPTPRQRKMIEQRIERGVDFVEAFAHAFVQDKYGAATTHWRKLEDRVHRGVGNPCPLVLIGLPASIVRFDAGEASSRNFGKPELSPDLFAANDDGPAPDGDADI